MDRSGGNVATSVILPCLMFVAVGYLSLFVDRENLTARLLLTIGSLFMVTLLNSAWNNDLPKVNYAKATDVYSGNSVALLFLALLCKDLVSSLSIVTRQRTIYISAGIVFASRKGNDITERIAVILYPLVSVISNLAFFIYFSIATSYDFPAL